MPRNTFIVLAAVTVAGCGGQQRDYAEFRSELAELKTKTASRGGRLVEATEPMPGVSSLHAAWTIDTGMSWGEYRAWMSKVLRTSWSASPDTDGDVGGKQLVFSRQITNEIFLLHAEPIAGQGAARVRLSFKVIAD